MSFADALGLKGIPYGLAGQAGFFDSFVVKFDYQKAAVELKQKDSGNQRISSSRS